MNGRAVPGLRHGAAAVVFLMTAMLFATGRARAVSPRDASPIQHVVIIDQENHSFDNVLGLLCTQVRQGKLSRPGYDASCDGVDRGTLADGTTVPLRKAKDVVPEVDHRVAAQQTAIDGGAMDGFSNINGCLAAKNYKCYTQFRKQQIPNVWNFATAFTISDRTFEQKDTPSWAGHLVLAAATTDGFQGDNPTFIKGPHVPHKGPGLGCDSNRQTEWWNGSAYQLVPSCIPDQEGRGPFTGQGTSPVPYVPTIFDLMDEVGVTWKIYGAGGSQAPTTPGYLWTMCPSFYECLGSSQYQNLVPASDVIGAAQDGSLPSVSFVTPTADLSQHNDWSMLAGDDWIGQVLGAIENGPDWGSTAVFLTWDDCGCFYDHVNPLVYGSDWGIRVPMIIVSPYAKQGYTDSTPAVFASMLAYVERTFGLGTLNPCGPTLGCTDDANAYDYAGAFDYSQTPLSPIPVSFAPIPRWERRYLREHPAPPDVT